MKTLPGIPLNSSQFLTMATLAAALLLPANLRSQSAEWMLFRPSDAGVLTDGILNLVVGPDGDIWMACNDLRSLTGHGLAIFDGRNWTVYNSDNSGLPSDSASAFAFDKLGNTWICTYNLWAASGGSGLAKLNGTNWTVYSSTNSSLPSDNIMAGTIDPEGHIWLATGAGVVRFDGQTWTVFSNSQIGLSKNWYSAIVADSKGNIWTGTYEPEGGVAKFDGQTWTAYTKANSGITDDGMANIVFDLQGNTWFSAVYQLTPPAGSLVKFDGKTWTTYTTQNSELPGGWGLAVDSEGMIWAGGGGILFYFGDDTGGVGRFDGHSWTVYKPDNSDMPARKAFALAQDSYGNMWMGTESGLVAYRKGGVIVPGVTPFLTVNPDGTLQMPSAVGNIYQMQATSDISNSPNWSFSSDPVIGTGDPIIWHINTASEKGFYRVKINQ